MVDGVPVQMTDAEIAERQAEEQAWLEGVNDRLADDIRMSRNKLLADTDWTQITDAPVNKDAWATYRQALRDITSQAGFPNDVTWPEKPE